MVEFFTISNYNHHYEINDFISFLKGLFNKLKESFNKLIFEVKKLSLNENSLSSNYLDERKVFNYLILEISQLLRDDFLFRDNEFYDFLMIKFITNFCLEDVELFAKYSDLIENLFFEFRKLIFNKVNLLKKDKNREYAKEYAKFSSFFLNKKEFFYFNIYDIYSVSKNSVVNFENVLEGDLIQNQENIKTILNGNEENFFEIFENYNLINPFEIIKFYNIHQEPLNLLFKQVNPWIKESFGNYDMALEYSPDPEFSQLNCLNIYIFGDENNHDEDKKLLENLSRKISHLDFPLETRRLILIFLV